MARLRKGPASQLQQPPTQTPSSARRALKEKTNTAHSQAPTYANDGETAGLVKDAKQGRGRGRPRKVQQDSDELVMAGGLGYSDEELAQLPSEPPTTTDELAKSDSGSMPMPKTNRRPPRTVRKIAQSQAQSKALEGLKQRMEATARGQRGKTTTSPTTSDAVVRSSHSQPEEECITVRSRDADVERSGLTISPSPPRPGRLSVAKVKRSSMMQPGSALKVQSTPAVENSFLALKNFKRRPRQMSMLSMVQQRTASARPSLAQDTVVVDDSSAFDFDLDGEEEDDFAPEAEGTPLHAEKSRRLSAASQRKRRAEVSPARSEVPTAGTKKRKSIEVDRIPASQNSLRSKRRKSTAEDPAGAALVDAAPSSPRDTIQVGSTVIESASSPARSVPRSEIASPGSASADAVHREDHDNIQVPSTEPERRMIELAQSAELIDKSDFDVPNGTMAEPASSSPAPNASARPDPDLIDPATQASPVASRPKRAKKQKPLSTATLQSLLPKRRKALKPRQKKAEYDMESSEVEEEVTLDISNLEEGEDELGGGLRRRTKTIAPKARKSTTAKKVPKRQPATVPAARGKRKASVAAPTTDGTKTYGRTTASDKENDGYESFEEADESTLPELSVSMQELAKSRELEEAKRKFAEVDDWDMEFESMSQDDHLRSSQSWR
ncbi:unnamed protein product [Zymoseptoria tritici ST99CH_3D1]|nr:unnamed protein product [Zymoseptoria tritici ST99CH_3D1]